MILFFFLASQGMNISANLAWKNVTKTQENNPQKSKRRVVLSGAVIIMNVNKAMFKVGVVGGKNKRDRGAILCE